MMEPSAGDRRVGDVDLSLNARQITGEVPIIVGRRAPMASATSTIVLNFEYFYAKERPAVARALRLTLHDDQLAQEATDEAMTRAYERWSTVATLDNPGGWVYRVGLNWARSVLRRSLRKRRPPDDLAYTPAAEAPDHLLQRAVASLDVHHRAVVVCRYYMGWNEAETAAALRVRPGTVKSRLHRALRELERELTPKAQEGQ